MTNLTPAPFSSLKGYNPYIIHIDEEQFSVNLEKLDNACLKSRIALLEAELTIQRRLIGLP